jgi:alkaline phosphatase D
LAAPKRSLRGAAQEAWLGESLKQSKARGATWQILAQQLVMGRQIMPPEAPAFLPQDASDGAKAFAEGGARLGRLDLPWNMDAWAGYPAARERLLAMCAQHGANVLALGGDSHNFWAHDLPGVAKEQPAAIELGVTSVTSPGLERTFRNAAPGARETAMRAANSELAWCDVTRRGYCLATLTAKGADARFRAFETVADSAAPALDGGRLWGEASKTGARPWVIA